VIRWNDIPFLRITASFIFGVWLYRFFTDVQINPLFVAGFAALAGIGFLLISLSRIPSKPTLALLTFTGFALLGFVTINLKIADQRPAELFSRKWSETPYYTAKIIGTPEKTARSVRYRAKVENVLIDDRWNGLEKEAILYIKEASGGPLHYGDLIQIRGTLSPLESNKNPHAFDYSLYLQRKGIWLQGFVYSYHLLPEKSLPSIWELASHSADFLDGLLAKYIPGERELNVARSMILGRRNEVSPEMEGAYQATGTSHILAVSGLHVGIIYLTLSFLFAFLNYGRFKLLYYGTILTGIWIFAMITGLSPSVLRAATMFSFFLIARLSGRDSNIYNTLFASAFFILLFSPMLIYSVSFQLSYLAVFGIVYLYNSIYGWFRIKNKVLDFFWKITALSVSVQIATFPVTIYYFHQFPALFALTNLFAIPTASVVMIGGMALLVLSGFVPGAAILGKILSTWIGIYNDIMLSFSKLPITAIEELHLKLPMVFLLMMMVAFLVRFVQARQLVIFKFFTLVLVFALTYSAMEFYWATRQIRITCYSTRAGSVCDVFLGQTCYSTSNTGEEELNYSVLPNRQYHGITTVKPISTLSHTNSTGSVELLVLQGKSLMFLKGSLPATARLPLKVDYLVLTDKAVTIPENLDYGVLVLNSASRKMSEKKASKIHVIKDQGAWSISL
jgi:competence protein ComEC